MDGASQGNGFRDLRVWQLAVDLSVAVYRATKGFPKDELFGLVSQMRRAAVSVPSNIAEGYGRCSAGDLRRFLLIARGSLAELSTQMEIARRLGLLSQETHPELFRLMDDVARLLNGFIRSVQTDTRTGIREEESEYGEPDVPTGQPD